MSDTTMKQTFAKQVAEPTLKDLLNVFKTEMLLTINCHAVGTVQSFDKDKQTVAVKINYKRKFAGQTMDYTVITQCPAVVLSGGTAALTMPIQAGDQCLILFNDRDLDNWFIGQNNKLPNSMRMHSFSDALAIVGLHPLGSSLQGYDASRAVLRNKNAMVGVGTDLVKVANNVTTLLTVINGLIDVIKGLTTIGSPTNQAIDPASQALLESYKTTVGGLLE